MTPVDTGREDRIAGVGGVHERLRGLLGLTNDRQAEPPVAWEPMFVGDGDSLTVEWLNAADQVVDSAVLTQLVTGIDAGIGPEPTVNNTLPAVGGLVIAVVDASGIPGTADSIAADLAARGYVVASVQPSRRTFQQSMMMPVNAPSDGSRELLTVLGIGGFDTWTPDLVGTPIADTVTDVIVIGTDGLSALTPPDSSNNTTTVP